MRKHAGLMVPGPVQAAAVVALADDDHVERQRDRYRRRLELAAEALGGWAGIDDRPSRRVASTCGSAPGDAWAFTERLARAAGALVSPGEFYGPGCARFVRVAVVQPDDRIELMAAACTPAGVTAGASA